ncbi:class I SAM-dependent DNA methyltransferase [Caulobacter sp. FWC2]|uniref:HsdM family class I SAM-dependent methyltransferase n=1 Tax=Caulobacter sp. FWC2 TaxID=69664 RepID=UPI000C15B288|nr:N-6 DNA methylase [Caulobacter sp. FWC2]PIB90500.1 SAM-dependent methyltransferase [Caulobacter sp. FWC2]
MVTWREGGRAILAHARRAAKEVEAFSGADAERVRLARDLLESRGDDGEYGSFSRVLAGLTVDERHYWVGVFYTLLLAAEVRRDQAAYFTPPYLAKAVLDLAIEYGFDLDNGSVLDPAAGGAAFLSTIAARMKSIGAKPDQVAGRLRGVDIDPGLARISRGLIADRLGLRGASSIDVHVGDALRRRWKPEFDLVVANPPYGRITPAVLTGDHWKKVAHSGNINKYAVFVELCLRAAKPGALVALVIPSSFRTGPLYTKLRGYLQAQAQVLCVGDVGPRDEVFADVAQDVSVLLLRKTSAAERADTRFCTINAIVGVTDIGAYPLPEDQNEHWPCPTLNAMPRGGATLADYGITAKAGYFVWNREGDRLRKAEESNVYPLIWAKNVKPGQTCRPGGKDGKAADFVAFEEESTSIVRRPAAVLQRTTNNKQPRRLVAAVVDPAVYVQWGGFVTENHTIVLMGDRAVDVTQVCQLLNTAAVDARYRALSGTAAVSVQLLRTLDLPKPGCLSAAEKVYADPEKAALAAYEASALLHAGRHVA